MSATARTITVIPPTANRFSSTILVHEEKKRVAAYARVSTENEEQLTSYEAQVDYYTRHIQSKDEWEMVEVYADEGISATSRKKRDGFNRMIADALDGKIDLILTKSVSRFARNTVDTLTTVRQLKERGVEVFFEKENIYTMDSKGELLITIMSSLAQEESRSISENVTWGQRKRFADGKVSMPYKRFLGYTKGPDGLPQIVEEQAATVRMIYRLYLEGKTTSAIAKHLTDLGISTPGGKLRWQSSSVESILTNEKYKGDAVLQKKFTVDFLTKKQKINEGEIPQYYVENSHPAIIPSEIHDLVQAEMRKRKEANRHYSGKDCFSSRIVCGECGGYYGSKVWHSTSKYRRVIWQCNHKFQGEVRCATPHLYEDTAKQAFVDAFNSLIENREAVIAGYDAVLEALSNTAELDTKAEKLRGEIAVIAEDIRRYVEENSHEAIDQDSYQQQYENQAEKYETLKAELDEIEVEKSNRITMCENIHRFIEALAQNEKALPEFNEDVWSTTVDKVIVYNGSNLNFYFKDGTELPWTI